MKFNQILDYSFVTINQLKLTYNMALHKEYAQKWP